MSTSDHLSRRVALWEKARQGDEQARDDLIEDFLSFARWHCNATAYHRDHITPDDLMGDAVEGIIRGIEGYNPEKHTTNLETYVCGWIRAQLQESDFIKSVFHETRHAVRSGNMPPPVISIYTPINAEGDSFLIDTLAFDEDRQPSQGISKKVADALLTLKEEERRAVDLHIGITGERLSFAKIATRLSIAPGTAHRYYHRGISKLKVILSD